MRFDGQALKRLRLERRWDQHRLAEEARKQSAGLTQPQISRYENGQEPSGRNALALARALGVDVAELYGEASFDDDAEEELPAAQTLDDYLRVRVRQIMHEESKAESEPAGRS